MTELISNSSAIGFESDSTLEEIESEGIIMKPLIEDVDIIHNSLYSQNKIKYQSKNSSSSTLSSDLREQKVSKHVTFGKITIEKIESFKKYNKIKTQLTLETKDLEADYFTFIMNDNESFCLNRTVDLYILSDNLSNEIHFHRMAHFLIKN